MSVRLLMALLALVGCRADFTFDSTPGSGAPPLADAGSGTTLRIGGALTLDGRASIDPDGTITSYTWSLTSAPSSSSAALLSSSDAVASFTPDAVGAYEFSLVVTDDDGNSDQSAVAFDVIELPVAVHAGADTTIEWRKSVQLAATVGVETGEVPVLSWSFLSKPSRSSATIQASTTLTPSFVADADGTYVLQLTATTSEHVGSDTITVVAAAKRVPFAGAFIDAVFDGWESENVLIAISDSPPRVRFIDPVTAAETSISLPSTPTALAMDPNGSYAAVATSGKLHIIGLFERKLMASYDISFAVDRLVLTNLGYVQCLTPQAGPIQTVDRSTGIVTPSSFSVPAGSTAKQAPTSSVMYGIEATTPRDLAIYYSSNAPADRLGDSPYTGQYQMGTDLWVLYNSIVVSTGNVFDSNPYNMGDMAYRGTLGAGTVEYAFAYSPKIITLHSTSATEHELRLYTSSSLALLDSAPLPDVIVNGAPQPAVGRLIDYSPSYPNRIIIVESAGDSNAFIVTDP